jgi:hypothetical protein
MMMFEEAMRRCFVLAVSPDVGRWIGMFVEETSEEICQKVSLESFRHSLFGQEDFANR